MRANLKTNLFFGAVLLATVASAPVGCNQSTSEKRADNTLVAPPVSPAQMITKSSPISTAH